MSTLSESFINSFLGAEMSYLSRVYQLAERTITLPDGRVLEQKILEGCKQFGRNYNKFIYLPTGINFSLAISMYQLLARNTESGLPKIVEMIAENSNPSLFESIPTQESLLYQIDEPFCGQSDDLKVPTAEETLWWYFSYIYKHRVLPFKNLALRTKNLCNGGNLCLKFSQETGLTLHCLKQGRNYNNVYIMPFEKIPF